MNANTKPQTVAPIETTTFDVALRHMKNGGFALARLYQNDALSLCYFDRARNAIQRLAFWKSTRYAEEIYAPFVHVVGADWVLLRRDAFVRNPEEAATDEAIRATNEEYVATADGAVRAFAAESAEAIDARETARQNALHGLLFHPRRPRGFGAELCAAWTETPRDAVRCWLASENCKDILLGDYDRVAAGVATGEDGRTYRVLRLWQGDDEDE